MIKPIQRFLRDIPLLFYRLINTHIEKGYIPNKVLVIVAHPDDPEYYFAGTIASWVQGGSIVRYLICTSGEIGSRHRMLTEDEIAAIREQEQISAAEVLGVKDVVFLHHKDGLLENTLELRYQLVKEIREFQPEVVVINDPNIWYGDNFLNHPDHRVAATAGLEAVFPLAGMPLLFLELEEQGIQPHQPRKVYIQTWQKPNTWININKTIELKIAAIKKHTSQIGEKDPSEEIRASAAKSAKFTGIKYAETYRVIELLNDDLWNKSVNL